MRIKFSLLVATLVACSFGQTTYAAFLTNHQQQRVEKEETTAPSSPFLSLQKYAVTAKNTVLWAAADVAETDDSSSPVDVVLFGIGDLRTKDHHGLYKALTSSNGSSEKSRILPVCFLSDVQLASLPGSIAHTGDTASLLAAALEDLSQHLREYGLQLQVQLTGEMLLPQALARFASDYSASSIRVHVSDLGDADNAMGYGSFGALQKDVAVLPANMEIETWSSHLRTEPWKQVDRLQEKYPDYEAAYASSAPPEPLSMPAPMSKMDDSRALTLSTEASDVPTAEMIQDRMMDVLQLDPARCEAERNTGLFSTHWGGLDPATVGSSAVESNLRAFVQDCREQDDVWSQHASYVTGKSRRNGRSLEHAAMRWQLAGDGKSPAGHTENWLAGESMTRYLAAPLLFGTISPTTVWHSSKAENYKAFFVSPLKRLVEAQEWHRLLAARNMRTDPEYVGQGPTTYRYWRWHGYLCRYAVTNLTDTSAVSDDQNEGIVLLHGFGASGAQWNKAMQELSKTSPTASQGLAPDLIGFGQSEKPALTYTSYLWDSYSIDFIKEIALGGHQWNSYSVGGNSIGGFTSICVAASDTAAIDSRSVSSSGAPGTGRCTGLVLMNSAGPVQTREEIEALQSNSQGLQLQSVAQNTAMDALPVCKPLSRPLARTFGNGLLSFLRPRIQSICKNLYPTNPAAVDETLCEAILRDSLDPGAVNVMISGAKLPPPRTVNELLGADFGAAVSREGSIAESTYDGPVLVSTGVLDPLNDAKDRTRRFGALRKGISIDEIQAGHCPHDELPGEIAMSISKWMTATRAERMARVSTAKSMVAN